MYQCSLLADVDLLKKKKNQRPRIDHLNFVLSIFLFLPLLLRLCFFNFVILTSLFNFSLADIYLFSFYITYKCEDVF